MGRAEIRLISMAPKVGKGQKVFALWKNKKFYLATVSEVKASEIVVAWDDGSPPMNIAFGNFSTEIAATAKATTTAPAAAPAATVKAQPATAQASATFKAGDKVEVKFEFQWYYSTILDVKDGQYFIHFDGDLPKYDRWVEPDLVRAQEDIRLLAGRPFPEDTYRGSDKATIKELVLQSWKKQFPDSQVLALRFPYDWLRNEGTVDNGVKTWAVDVSTLSLLLIVKGDNERAYVYPCSVTVDNIKKGPMEVRTTMTGAGSYVPSQMLVKNVK
jgi:hypothetical protein